MIHNTHNMARALRYGLAFQHLLAVFAGTVFVPIVLGLPVAIALLFSGVGTLMFHYFTYSKLPLYFSTSFTVLAGMMFIRQTAIGKGMPEDIALCYVCLCSMLIGLIYILISQAIRFVPERIVKSVFSPALAGPVIMVIGIDMLFSSTYSLQTDWIVGTATILAVAVAQLLCRGPLRIMSVNIGVLTGLAVAAARGALSFDAVGNVAWIASPFDSDYMGFRVLEQLDMDMLAVVVLTAIPLSLIALGEHISDIIIISHTTKIDYMHTIGLQRTISANGLATILAAVFGSSQNTAYSQTTGLIRLNRICDPNILRMAAVMMIVLACCPKLGVLVSCIPIAVIGAITFIMYCMIILIGWHTVYHGSGSEKKYRYFTVITAVIVVYALIKIFFNGGIPIGSTTLTSITAAFLTGLILNIAIPRKHEENP